MVDQGYLISQLAFGAVNALCLTVLMYQLIRELCFSMSAVAPSSTLSKNSQIASSPRGARGLRSFGMSALRTISSPAPNIGELPKLIRRSTISMAVLLIVKSVDPNGYWGIWPKWFNYLLTFNVTAFIFVTGMLIIHQSEKTTAKICLVPMSSLFTFTLTALGVVTFCLAQICSLTAVLLDMSLPRGLYLIWGGVVAATIALSWFLSLRRLQRAISVTTAAVAQMVSPLIQSTDGSERIKSIVRFNRICSLLLLIASGAQLYVGAVNLQGPLATNNPDVFSFQPDMFAYLQTLGVCAAFLYTWHAHRMWLRKAEAQRRENEADLARENAQTSSRHASSRSDKSSTRSYASTGGPDG